MTSISSLDYVLLFFSVCWCCGRLPKKKTAVQLFYLCFKVFVFSIKNNSKIKSLSPFPVLSVCVCVSVFCAKNTQNTSKEIEKQKKTTFQLHTKPPLNFLHSQKNVGLRVNCEFVLHISGFFRKYRQ